MMTHSGMKRVELDILMFEFKISAQNALEKLPFTK